MTKFDAVEFDAVEVVKRLKEQTKAIRKRSYAARISKLDKFKGEVMAMYKNGSSAAEIQRWLQTERIRCALSTVTRYIQKNG